MREEEEKAAAVTAETQKYNQPVDQVFLIDASGSMESSIEDCKNNPGKMITNLYAAGITARVAVLSFDDFENEKKEFLRSFLILPIYSNPAAKDGDKDGEKEGDSYGGNQGWFTEGDSQADLIKASGCGRSVFILGLSKSGN